MLPNKRIAGRESFASGPGGHVRKWQYCETGISCSQAHFSNTRKPTVGKGNGLERNHVANGRESSFGLILR